MNISSSGWQRFWLDVSTGGGGAAWLRVRTMFSEWQDSLTLRILSPGAIHIVCPWLQGRDSSKTELLHKNMGKLDNIPGRRGDHGGRGGRGSKQTDRFDPTLLFSCMGFFSVIQTNASSRNTYTGSSESSVVQRDASVIQRASVCITESLPKCIRNTAEDKYVRE